jgi:hypothetical protein
MFAMIIAIVSDLLASHGFRVRTIATADGAKWISVTGATKAELEQLLPEGFAVVAGTEGALMVVPASAD